MIKEAIAKIVEGKNLSRRESERVIEEILSGRTTNSQIASFLTAMRIKHETADEITGAVIVMRRHVNRIRLRRAAILDTCGTGGDKKGTFNISTIAAFVAAGCGITVAKHGNRSVSSLCGSADLLEGLGIDINMNEEKIEKCLKEVGIAFLFAPNLHPAMKYAMPVRREIGIRTMFNVLGPLTNPEGATQQFVGVYSGAWLKTIAEVLKNLGTRHALVVHGQDGLDEITLTDKTMVAELNDGRVKTYTIQPADFGMKKVRLKTIFGGPISQNAQILKDVLQGKRGPTRDIVLLNAGAAIYAADKAGCIKEGIDLARRSIDSGAAWHKFELLKEYSRK